MDPDTTPPDGQNGSPRTFTQAELDQVVARQRREWQERLEAVSRERDELKTKHDQVAAKVAELEPFKARAEALEPLRVDNALLTETVKAGAKRPHHIVQLLKPNVKLEGDEVKGIDAALEALRKESPDYFQSAPAAPSDGGARDRSAPPPQTSANDQINAALRGAAGYPSR